MYPTLLAVRTMFLFFQSTPRAFSNKQNINTAMNITSDADFGSILECLHEPDDQEDAVLAAIRDDNEQRVCQIGPSLSEQAGLRAKLEAVVLQKPGMLKILLECNRELSDDVVAEAFQRKDRACIGVALDSGWDINKPLWAAAPLW